MATHAAIAASPLIREILPDLATLWPTVANPRVRFTGTIGGNVMVGNPDYDALPALMALGAEPEVAPGLRTSLDTLGPDSLVTAFIIPNPTTLRLFADRSLRPALTVWLGLSHTRPRPLSTGRNRQRPPPPSLRYPPAQSPAALPRGGVPDARRRCRPPSPRTCLRRQGQRRLSPPHD